MSDEIICWCPSGKSYRDCHLKEGAKKPLTFLEEKKKLRKIWRKEYCLHPLKHQCSKNIVEAHTVQRAMLKKISHNSHVYTPVIERTPDNLKLEMKLVGIGDASVFTGFCGFHDNKTFEPIEDADFTGSDEQCFLYAYRAVARELFLKKAHQVDREFLLSPAATAGKTSQQIERERRIFEYELKGITAAVNDLNALKSRMDGILHSGKFNEVHNCIFWIDRYPEILCNGKFQPDFDFGGNLLQDWSDVNRELESISLSFITAPKNKGAIVLAWHQTSDKTSQALINSLLIYPDERKPNLLVNWAVKELENIFLAPSWWEFLHPTNQQIVLEEFQDHPSMLTPRLSDYLTAGRIEGFNWKIEKITSNYFTLF